MIWKRSREGGLLVPQAFVHPYKRSREGGLLVPQAFVHPHISCSRMNQRRNAPCLLQNQFSSRVRNFNFLYYISNKMSTYYIKQDLDLNYTFTMYLTPNRVTFCDKSIRKV